MEPVLTTFLTDDGIHRHQIMGEETSTPLLLLMTGTGIYMYLFALDYFVWRDRRSKPEIRKVEHSRNKKK